ncbi:MAG: LysM peptidoglycan-binding domain-containing protein [Chloroflexota bacterium]
MANDVKKKLKPAEDAVPSLKGEGTIGQESEISSYLEDGLYDGFIASFQRGEWKESEAKLEKLIEKYPLENELRYLHHDLTIRSGIDENEHDDDIQDLKDRTKKIITWTSASVAGIVVIAMIYGLSASWLKEKREVAEATVQQIALEISLNTKYQDSRAFIQGDKFNEALSLLRSIEESDPNFPGLEDALAQAESLVATNDRYEEAMDLKLAGEGISALEIFREIVVESPFFKDIEAQIRELERDYELGEMLAQGEAAFNDERWIDAINYFEGALAIDADINIKDMLFDSYIHGAESILISEDLSLEDLELAETYFRNSLSLKPQNREALDRRANVNDSIAGLLSTGYIQAAQNFLVDHADSLNALDQATVYFGKALSINPDGAEIRLQYNLARRFLSAESKFRNGAWSDAIDDLEFVFASDSDYANGTAEQMLYEAYGARGNSYLVVGDFGAALDDFQQAALIAGEDPDSALRLFEAQINVAYALGRLGKHRDAVGLYEAALVESGFKSQLTEEDAELSAALLEGERAAIRRDYRSAYVWYSDALRGNTSVFSLVRHTVGEDEYLSQIARQYNSTVQAIIEANNLVYPYYLLPGQILLIPSIK